MSTLKVDTILKRTGTGTITLGQSGDTIALGSGASATGFGETNTPQFLVRKTSSNQTINRATATLCTFNTEDIDCEPVNFAENIGSLSPPNPVAEAPDPNAIVSPDCPSVIVPVPVLFNIVSTFNVLMLIYILQILLHYQ